MYTLKFKLFGHPIAPITPTTLPATVKKKADVPV